MNHNEASFTDIKITGPNDELTNVPEPSRPAMYDVYFRLSDSPPDEWVQAFMQAWQLRMYSMKRRAWIESDHLIIHCALAEIEKYHKRELLAVISQVNQEYKKLISQQALRATQAAERQAVEDQKKKNILGGLKFD